MPLLQPRDEIAFGPAERGYVLSVVRRFVRTAQEAEDITQETLLLAYRHRDAFRGHARYRTWLYRIAVTTALGHLRRQRRRRELLARDGEAPAYEPTDPAHDPEQVVAEREAAALARRELGRLAPKLRDVLALRADDCTDREIAARLGISVPNVKIRTHRARRQLRSQLASLLPEPA